MSKNRILVIEDNKDIADSIGLNLELSGYDYTIIDDGLEAAKRLSEDHSFDLALLDVMLPGLDGFADGAYAKVQYPRNIPDCQGGRAFAHKGAEDRR